MRIEKKEKSAKRQRVNEVSKVKSGMFLGAVNLNEYDLQSVNVRNWLFQLIKDKNVNLVMFNASIYQASLQSKISKSLKEIVKDEVIEKVEAICKYVEKLVWMLNRADLYFIIEGAKSHLKTVTLRVQDVWIEKGRGIRIRKDKSEVNVKNWVLHNLGESKNPVSHWRSKPVELRLSESSPGKVRGLLEKSWQRWVCLKVKDRMCQHGRVNIPEAGMTFSMEVDEVRAAKMEFWDDMSGKRLDARLIKEARDEEMVEVRKHAVYVKVPLSQCRDETGRAPVGVRWVDVNKGDDTNPEYRSRLVAQELKRTSIVEDLFAATPPLEAKKILFSMAVTEAIGFEANDRQGGMKLDFIDVRRAYFHAPARRRVYVKLPPEDAAEGMCGLLKKSMYRTRDAAQNWEVEYSSFMITAGFRRGEGMPCVFFNPLRNLRVVVHGDDFTILGHGGSLDWFRLKIQEKFEVKIRGRIGPK